MFSCVRRQLGSGAGQVTSVVVTISDMICYIRSNGVRWIPIPDLDPTFRVVELGYGMECNEGSRRINHVAERNR
jgi:hypothetical protein